jgi:hypothetical protein
MSNELSLLNGNLPAHLRGQIDETTKALMGSGGGSTGTPVKRISIKGSVFRMVVDGKEVAKNEERAMNVIVVGAAQYNSRTFYEGVFQEGQTAGAPTCFSDNGITPSPRSTSAQSATCKDCPQNVDGSHSSGRGRACRFSRRLAVLLENDQKGDVFQLTLPAQSIFGKPVDGKMPLEAYVRLLGTNGVSVTSVVTEMRFDTSSATPKLTFKAVRYLEADEFANSQAKGKTSEARSAIGLNAGEVDTGVKLAAPVVEAAPAAEAPKAEAVEPTKRAKKSEAETPKDINAVLDDWA